MTDESFSDDASLADDDLDLEEDLNLDLEDDVSPEDFQEEEVDEDEYEEISSDEVDRVVAVLEELIESVESENIQYHLEQAADTIFGLVYEVEQGNADSDAA